MKITEEFLHNGLYTFVNFRNISFEETKLVWQWRNHIDIRKWMYNQNIIEFEDHIQFIESLKNDISKNYCLVKRNNVCVGVTSLVHIKGLNAEWGYYIAPKFHEANLVVEFYFFAIEFIFSVLGMETIYGYALVENKGANSMNDLFGFTSELATKEIDGEKKRFLYRELSVDTWENKIRNDKRIERLLLFTLNKK